MTEAALTESELLALDAEQMAMAAKLIADDDDFGAALAVEAEAKWALAE